MINHNYILCHKILLHKKIQIALNKCHVGVVYCTLNT